MPYSVRNTRSLLVVSVIAGSGPIWLLNDFCVGVFGARYGRRTIGKCRHLAAGSRYRAAMVVRASDL